MTNKPLPFSPLRAVCWLWLCWLGWQFLQALPDSYDWRLAQEAVAPHFAAWRMAEGDAPYRDVLVYEAPMVLWLHRLALMMGYEDSHWRVFDLMWSLLAAGGIWALCRPKGWLAGGLGAVIFLCYHLGNGNRLLGAPDFLMCPMLLWGVWLVARAVEGRRPALCLASAGLLLGAAAWVRPTALLLAMGLALWLAWRRVPRAQVLWLAAGVAVAALLGAGLLAVSGGWEAFWQMPLALLMPAQLADGAIGPVGAVLAALADVWMLLVFFLLPVRNEPRFQLLSLLVLSGAVHAIAADKGWTAQAYPLAAAMAAFMPYRLPEALGAPQALVRGLAVLAVGLACWLSGPVRVLHPGRLWPEEMALPGEIQAVLAQLEPASVQLMDSRGEALLALYRLGWPAATRHVVDMPLYNSSPMAPALAEDLMATLPEAMPQAVVVTASSWPDESTGFDRLERIEGFNDWLAAHYELKVEQGRMRLYMLAE